MEIRISARGELMRWLMPLEMKDLDVDQLALETLAALDAVCLKAERKGADAILASALGLNLNHP